MTHPPVAHVYYGNDPEDEPTSFYFCQACEAAIERGELERLPLPPGLCDEWYEMDALHESVTGESSFTCDQCGAHITSGMSDEEWDQALGIRRT